MHARRKTVVWLTAIGVGGACLAVALPLGPTRTAGMPVASTSLPAPMETAIQGEALYGVAPKVSPELAPSASSQPSLPSHPPTFWGQEWLRRTAPGTEPFMGAWKEGPGTFGDGGVYDRASVMGDPAPENWGPLRADQWSRLRAVGLGKPWNFIALQPDGKGWVERDNVQTVFGPRVPPAGLAPPGSEWVNLWRDEEGRVRALLRGPDGAFLGFVELDARTGATVGPVHMLTQEGVKTVQPDGGFVDGGEEVFGGFGNVLADRDWHVGAVAVEGGVVLWEGMWEPDSWDKSRSRRAFWVMDTEEKWVSEIPTSAPVPFTPTDTGEP